MWILKQYWREEGGFVKYVICKDFKLLLHGPVVIHSKIRPKSEESEKKEGEIDPKFWELLMSADKKDYEPICSEFGVTDFRWMLKKLNEMKKEREEEQAAVCLLTTCG